MSGANHGVAKFSLGLGASRERVTNDAQYCGVTKGLWFCLLEAGGEFVGVVDDLLGCAWHRDHLRYETARLDPTPNVRGTRRDCGGSEGVGEERLHL